MKLKAILFCKVAVVLLAASSVAGASGADTKGDVTSTQPNGVKYGRQAWADSTLNGGIADKVPGGGVVIGLPGPCDYDPKRCDPPDAGGGGSGVVTPPVVTKSFTHTFSGKWSNGTSIGSLYEMGSFALPDAPGNSKALITIDSLTKLSGCGGFDTASSFATWWPNDYSNWDGPGAWGGSMSAPLYACPSSSAYSYRVEYTVIYP